jgi:hypothetical protein
MNRILSTLVVLIIAIVGLSSTAAAVPLENGSNDNVAVMPGDNVQVMPGDNVQAMPGDNVQAPEDRFLKAKKAFSERGPEDHFLKAKKAFDEDGQ